jgi:small subunit ribosomal protein S17
MPEEEKQEPEETAEPQAAEEEAEGGAAGTSDEVAEDAVEPAATSEPEPAGNGAEGEAPRGEVLGPKQLRKRERSRASGPARPPRSAEERASDRASHRLAAAEGRRRHRASSRAKRGEPGTGTEPTLREPGTRKIRQGTVVSTGGDKTITVEIAVVRRHPTYEKVVRRTSRLRAHDEENQANEGDMVRVIETRPLSRTKRWRLLDVLERAPR